MAQSDNGTGREGESMLAVSVVVATFNRLQMLLDLLNSLAKQTIPAGMFEVIVVDDGSRTPVKPALSAMTFPFRLTVLEQANAGAAAARHRGIMSAAGDIIVIVDDDMLVGPEFLHHHLRTHRNGATLVLGKMEDELVSGTVPLFSRFHSDQLYKQYNGFKTKQVKPRGINLYTGNASFRRSDYFKVGGFDPTLARGEDAELGVRLEKAGARIAYCDEAKTINRSGLTDREVWFQRNYLYGRSDVRIAKKHHDVDIADPWRFLFEVNPVSRPLLVFSASFPGAGAVFSRAVMRVAEAADEHGFPRAAVAGATLSYGLEYFRGVREETGSVRDAARDFADYLKKRRKANTSELQSNAVSSQETFVLNEEQVYLDRNGQKIYCVQHEAQGEGRGVVVLVGPLGLERTHAYAVWVQWARALSGAGYHAFRFDFAGVGESTGEFGEQTLQGWQGDAERVFQHAKQQYPSLPIALVGLRGGCLIASHLFREGAGEALLLWEPPPSGEAMAMEILRRKLAADYAEHTGGERKTRDDYIADMERGLVVEVEGYPWTKALWHSAKSYSLAIPRDDERRSYRIVHLDGRDPARALSKTHGFVFRIPKPFFWMESKVLQPDLNELFSDALRWLSAIQPVNYAAN